MTATVLVLGHSGMLGHVVARYLAERGFRVLTLGRRFTAGREHEFLDAVRSLGASVVVNCIGVRPSAELDASEVKRMNGDLPKLLASGIGESLLVQPSTDAVFDGSRGPSEVTRPPDAEDVYGRSKREGERAVELGRAVVLRSSLVGPELGPPRSLLGWLTQQTGRVRGFTDQLWNGITTLGWAELCSRAILGEIGEGIHQPGIVPAVTKGELVKALRDAWDLELEVALEPSGTPLDRRLVPTHPFPPIRDELARLRRWYEATPK